VRAELTDFPPTFRAQDALKTLEGVLQVLNTIRSDTLKNFSEV
jgi:hypothetical protein